MSFRLDVTLLMPRVDAMPRCDISTDIEQSIIDHERYRDSSGRHCHYMFIAWSFLSPTNRAVTTFLSALF